MRTDRRIFSVQTATAQATKRSDLPLWRVWLSATRRFFSSLGRHKDAPAHTQQQALVPSLADWQLEKQIARATRRMVEAQTKGEQRAAFRHLQYLTRQRSPAQIERMERRRGLR